MARKSHPIGIRLDPAQRAALERFAEADDRAVSGLMRRILADWLKQREAERAEGANS